MTKGEQIRTLERLRDALPTLNDDDPAPFIAVVLGLSEATVRRIEPKPEDGSFDANVINAEIASLKGKKRVVRLPRIEMAHYRLLKLKKAEHEANVLLLEEASMQTVLDRIAAYRIVCEEIDEMRGGW